jgi:Bacteriophage T4-like portal protein (Gp20)
MAWKLFGFSLGRESVIDDISGLTGDSASNVSFVAPENFDGTQVIETGGFMSSVYDFGGSFMDENSLIKQYRSMSLYPEVDMAIEDIVTQAIVFDSEHDAIKVSLSKVELSDNIKSKINYEFSNILKLLDFKNKGYDIFRRWYVDGRVYFQNIIDVEHPEKGITELRAIDPVRIRKVRKVQKEVKRIQNTTVPVVKKVEEHYVYTDYEISNMASTTSATGVKISPDSITYCHSGYIDQTSKRVVGHLHKAIRPLNMLRQTEDAMVVYRIARAPERRIFYVDVGNLPKQKAEEYIKNLMNRYRNKLTYDSATGEIKDQRNHMSMLEDYWLPRREGGKGTEITTLAGGQNLSEMEDVEYLLRKLYRALNVPLTRMEVQTGFNLGRSSEITRDEVKFYKFIERLQNKFAFVFLDILKKQCVLRGILTLEDWNNIYQDIDIIFNKDSYFTELKENEIMRERVDMLNTIGTYNGVFFSTNYVRKKILKQTDAEIAEMDIEIENDRQKQIEQQIQMQQLGLVDNEEQK